MPTPEIHFQEAQFLTRRGLASRWSVHRETIKRYTKAGILNPVYLSPRKLLYKLSEIEAVEKAGTR